MVKARVELLKYAEFLDFMFGVMVEELEVFQGTIG